MRLETVSWLKEEYGLIRARDEESRAVMVFLSSPEPVDKPEKYFRRFVFEFCSIFWTLNNSFYDRNISEAKCSSAIISLTNFFQPPIVWGVCFHLTQVDGRNWKPRDNGDSLAWKHCHWSWDLDHLNVKWRDVVDGCH